MESRLTLSIDEARLERKHSHNRHSHDRPYSSNQSDRQRLAHSDDFDDNSSRYSSTVLSRDRSSAKHDDTISRHSSSLQNRDRTKPKLGKAQSLPLNSGSTKIVRHPLSSSQDNINKGNQHGDEHSNMSSSCVVM